jgi:hypothetical protein|tara:strand:- start:260 stop:940 length:681 start_codon:yes stop_codon:yes gene_type:complete
MENNPTLYELFSGGYTPDEHRKRMRTKGKPELNLHTSLDMLGMLPGVGNPADLANSMLYALEGDTENSLFSLTQAIPGLGLVAGLKKMVKPSRQIKKVNKLNEVFRVWRDNLDEFVVQNPGRVDMQALNKDIVNARIRFEGDEIKMKNWIYEKNSELGLSGYVDIPRATPTRGDIRRSELKKGSAKVKEKAKVADSPEMIKAKQKKLDEDMRDKGARFTKSKLDEY